jgi:hypothetical protein
MSRLHRALLPALASSALALGGVAEGEDTSKLYWGAGLAVTDFESKHEGVRFTATPAGWQLYGGLQARERMAVELAVERLSGVELDDVRGSGLTRLRISADDIAATVRGVFSLSLQEILPRRQSVVLFATAGIERSLEERDVLDLHTGRATSVAERDFALVVGAGVTFDLARVRLRTHVQSADRAAGALNSVGVAAEFRF